MFKNTNCPKCAGVLRLTNEEVDFRLKDSNIQRTEDYINNKIIMSWYCLICKQTFTMSAKSLFKTISCPYCHKSFGENTTCSILLENSFDHIRQYKINANNRKYFIDFYLPKYNLFIEYNGRQHYEEMNYINFDLAAVQKRDAEVREYCYDNDILLFEIDSRLYKNTPYTDKVEFKKQLENDILNQISLLTIN